MLVKDVMTRWPATVTPATSVMEARRLLRRHDCRHLPVVEDDAVVGMVSDRDLLLRDRQLAEALGLLQSELVDGRYRRVGDVMTTPAITVAPDVAVAAAAALLDHHRISALPVVEEGRLVGIVTSRDLLGILDNGTTVLTTDHVERQSTPSEGIADEAVTYLPADLVSVPMGPGDARPGRPAQRPSALVIDPDAATRIRLSDELTRDGYEVATCPGPCTGTRCPALDGGDGQRCPRLPADVGLVAVDQRSARTRLLEAYARWAPDVHVWITDTLSAPSSHEPR